jgi:serine/threonine-protein kinase RsbW
MNFSKLFSKTKLLRKTWSSCPNELSDIRKNISEICEQLGYPQSEISAIVLAIDEACTNIIRYAYDNCKDGKIRIEITTALDKTTGEHQVIFRLYDFAKKVSKNCIKKKASDPMKPGGLGVVLMQQVMDSVEFVHTRFCRGNILEMKKSLPKEKKQSEL